MWNSLNDVEGGMLLWIQENVRMSWLDPVMHGITSLGNHGSVWIVLVLLLIILPRFRFCGLVSGVSLMTCSLLTNRVLKLLFDRPRPYEVTKGLDVIGKIYKDPSFPSGHTSAAFSVGVVCLILLPRKYGVPVFVLAVLMGISRMYIGVHFPTDVLGGAVFGTLCALLAVGIWKILERRIKHGNN